MSIKSAIFVPAMLLLSGAAPAPAPVPAPGASNARASDGGVEQVVTIADEKVVCRREKAVGSRVTAKRVCMTAQQWETKRMEDRRQIEQGQAQRTFTDTSG